jgi:hypothetical protein
MSKDDVASRHDSDGPKKLKERDSRCQRSGGALWWYTERLKERGKLRLW